MKKLVLILTLSVFVTGISYAQRVNMTVGEKIVVTEITKGFSKGAIFFEQNNQKLKYVHMFRTLLEIEACSENMALAKKHRTGAIVMTVVGLVTFPLGYLILVGPILSKKKKEIKYVKLAIEDYNASL